MNDVHKYVPGGWDCSFCDGYGWLHEQLSPTHSYVKATCPMCKGSGRCSSDENAPKGRPQELPEDEPSNA